MRSLVNPARGSVIPTRGGNFAKYPTWESGLADWCERILQRYIAERGLDTLGKAIPVYAPRSDRNNEAAYVAAVVRDVDRWQQEDRG